MPKKQLSSVEMLIVSVFKEELIILNMNPTLVTNNSPSDIQVVINYLKERLASLS